ncbi:MAG: U32 family peptidase, partial [Clostridia bacterium]|nr:U32 family peptidase [Clostridia bacterium]
IPDTDYFDIIYLPLERFEPGRANGIILPPVVFDGERGREYELVEKAVANGAEHIMICNPGQIDIAVKFGGRAKIHLDFRFNSNNKYTAAQLLKIFGAEDIILSPELALPQIRDIGNCRRSVIVYGRLPLMLLHKRLGADRISDRTGAAFPIIAEWGRDVLYNSAVTYTADNEKELRSAAVFNRHFIFTDEKPSEILRIIKAYKERSAPPKDMNFRRIPKIKRGQRGQK